MNFAERANPAFAVGGVPWGEVCPTAEGEPVEGSSKPFALSDASKSDVAPVEALGTVMLGEGGGSDSCCMGGVDVPL